MRLTRNNTKLSAFTSTDLLMVIGVIFLLASIFAVWTIRTKRTRLLSTCVDNQKQIVLSFKFFAGDSIQEFPVDYFKNRAYQFPSNSNRAVWEYLCLASNELGTAKVLVCPEDVARRTNWATGFSNAANGLAHPSRQTNSISYFLGMAGDETKPNTIALGDRNLALDSNSPLYSSWGGVAVNMVTNYAWRSFPKEPFHKNEGVFALSDGSVHRASSDLLQEALRLARQSYGTNANRFLFPQ